MESWSNSFVFGNHLRDHSESRQMDQGVVETLSSIEFWMMHAQIFQVFRTPFLRRLLGFFFFSFVFWGSLLLIQGKMMSDHLLAQRLAPLYGKFDSECFQFYHTESNASSRVLAFWRCCLWGQIESLSWPAAAGATIGVQEASEVDSSRQNPCQGFHG